MAVHALEAAKHACQESGWTLSNLQLQKILYIAHMLYMGRTNTGLIYGDQFEAWDYGPVLPSVYRHVAAYGANPIKNIFHGIPEIDGEEARAITDAVQRLKDIRPYKLVELVHDTDSAWSQAYDSSCRGMPISDDLVLKEYSNRFPEPA